MRMPIAAVFGWVLFNEFPDFWTWFGAIIIRNAIRRKENAEQKEIKPWWIDKQLAKLATSIGRVDSNKK